LTPERDFALVVDMLTDEEREFLGRATTTVQIIVGALAAGVVAFAIVALAIAPRQAAPPAAQSLLTYMSLAMAIVAVIAAMVVPRIVVRNQRQAILGGTPTLRAGSIGGPPLPEAEHEFGPLVAGYQTALIVRSAILEGAAFFCLISYVIEGQALSLIGAGVLLLFLLSGFPTESRIEDAIQNERATIQQLRQMEPTHAR
jgi:hypothetical protein